MKNSTILAGGFAIGLAKGLYEGYQERQKQRQGAVVTTNPGEILTMTRASFDAWVVEHDRYELQAFQADVTQEFQGWVREHDLELQAIVNDWLVDHDARMVAAFNTWIAAHAPQADLPTYVPLAPETMIFTDENGDPIS